MSDRAQQTVSEGSLDYRQDAVEGELPSQPSDPQRNPGITQDLATLTSRQEETPQEDIEIDMNVGVGEDPGWQRPRHQRRWHQESQRSVQHGT